MIEVSHLQFKRKIMRSALKHKNNVRWPCDDTNLHSTKHVLCRSNRYICSSV